MVDQIQSYIVGPVCALAISLVGLKILWPFLVKQIEGRISDLQKDVTGLQESLNNCHKEHSLTKEKLAATEAELRTTQNQLHHLSGEVSMLEKFKNSIPGASPATITNIVEAKPSDKAAQ